MASLEPDLFELFRGIFGALMKGGLINDTEFNKAHEVLNEHDPMAEQRAAEAEQAKRAQDWAEYQRLSEQFGQQQTQAASDTQDAPQAPPVPSAQFPPAFEQRPPAPPLGPPPGPPPVPSAGGGFHQEGPAGG